MAALDNAMISKILNALTPVGAAGVPGTSLTALAGSAMKVKLTSTVSTASASGTELTGSGYTAGGTAVPGQSTASSAGSNVTLPTGGALSWTNSSGGNWAIQSIEVTDSAGLRVWWGLFNGAPVNVANLNTFQIAANAVTISLV